MTNSRAKGCRGELEWSKFLQAQGFEARRGQQFSGNNGDPDVVSNMPIHWEVKRVEKLNLDNALKQADNDAKQGMIPIVAHRKNGQKWNITISAENFFRIYKGEV